MNNHSDSHTGKCTRLALSCWSKASYEDETHTETAHYPLTRGRRGMNLVRQAA